MATAMPQPAPSSLKVVPVGNTLPPMTTRVLLAGLCGALAVLLGCKPASGPAPAPAPVKKPVVAPPPKPVPPPAPRVGGLRAGFSSVSMRVSRPQVQIVPGRPVSVQKSRIWVASARKVKLPGRPSGCCQR